MPESYYHGDEQGWSIENEFRNGKSSSRIEHIGGEGSEGCGEELIGERSIRQ